MPEQNSKLRTLPECQIEFSDSDGNVLFSIDLIEAELQIEHLYKEWEQAKTGKHAGYLADVQAWLTECKPEVKLTTSQVWCFVEHIEAAWAQLKKKFETGPMLPTTTDSTPSGSTNENSTTTPPSCPDSPPNES